MIVGFLFTSNLTKPTFIWMPMASLSTVRKTAHRERKWKKAGNRGDSDVGVVKSAESTRIAMVSGCFWYHLHGITLVVS